MINPGARLKAAASLVREGSKVADVGTDHAYLPAFLVESGRVVSAIACDIGDGPIFNAAATVRERRLEDRITLRKCDGLDGVSPDEADDIVICGMGGELIARIIDRAGWLRDPSKQMILQPMSAADDLRIYLADNGFSVTDEITVKDGGRLYVVMRAHFTGERYIYPAEYPYIGNIAADTPLGREYLAVQLKRVLRHADMIKNTDLNETYELLVKVAGSIRKRMGESE